MTTHAPKTTTAFYAQAVIAFGTAVIAVGLGVVYLPGEPWPRAFLALGILFLITSTFTLAKCVRDQQDAGTVVSRLDEARLERLLAEFDPYHSSSPTGLGLVTPGGIAPQQTYVTQPSFSTPSGSPAQQAYPAMPAA